MSQTSSRASHPSYLHIAAFPYFEELVDIGEPHSHESNFEHPGHGGILSGTRVKIQRIRRAELATVWEDHVLGRQNSSNLGLKNRVLPSTSSKVMDSLISSIAKRVDNVLKLRSFEFLEENWNGYGGLSIDKQLIQKCIQLLHSGQLLRLQPDIFPTGRGSVQFEYEEHDGRYLEIEFFSNGNNGIYGKFPGEPDVEVENVEWETILDLIMKFDA